jgi:KUP system potassium uptake protein
VSSANDSNASRSPNRAPLLAAAVGGLGVVYGDIGTSPLYALRACFHGAQSVAPTSANILGILSLILWSLFVIISVKYLLVVMRADNEGEGGVLALMALVLKGRSSKRARWAFTLLGLFGAGLLYGDGMITPAISILSAVEGLEVATPAFGKYVVPISLAILAVLFALQRRGTSRMASVFGPVMLLWFLSLIALGIPAIVREPHVLASFNPLLAVDFLLHDQGHAFLILGVVFLVVTGGEALYADMGHFGLRPIRLAWFSLVLPSLVVNYLGQGALLISDPTAVRNPFYLLAPSWARYPLVLLATLATVIASQAVITGAFSLASQAVRLGYSPRLRIIHTSEDHRGQVYLPLINWALFVAVIGLILEFRSSAALAGAYGMAVSSTMLITTVLLYVVARDRWNWGRPTALVVMGCFLILDIAFVLANGVKLFAGGWLPLVIGIVACLLMTTWQQGRRRLRARLKRKTESVGSFLDHIESDLPHRVPGAAIYLSAHSDGVPLALLHNLKHNKVLHEVVVILRIVTDEHSRVSAADRVEIERFEHGFFRVTARYGFMEHPNIKRILTRCRKQGLDFDATDVSYVLGRETLEVEHGATMSRFRRYLFAWMSRNANDASSHFGLPPDGVMEIGVKLEI